MRLRQFFYLLAVTAICTVPVPALAVSPLGATSLVLNAQNHTAVIEMLQASGYQVTSMKRTLLGRVKVRVRNGDHIREVVVSWSTGEIKSDRIVRNFKDNSTRRTSNGSTGASNRNSGGNGNSNSGGNGNGNSGGNGNGNSGGNGNGNSGGNGNGNSGGNGNGNSGGNGNGNSGGNGNGNSGGNGNGRK